MIAHAAAASGGPLWRRWTAHRLLLASAELAKGIVLAKEVEGDNRDLLHVLRKIAEIIEELRSGPFYELRSSSCSISSVLINAAKEYEAQEGIVRFVVPVDPGPLIAIPEFTIASVLRVLVDNAIEAITSQAADCFPSGKVDVTVETTGTHTDIYVADNGPGIPEDVARRVFRGPTPSSRGHGISLLAARGAALAFGGDLVLVESRHGTRFRLRVPLA